MVTRNGTIRRREAAIFCSAIEEAAESFATVLLADPMLPPLRLSMIEFESGNWLIADEYEAAVLRIIAEITVHQQYELSAAQLREALIRGAKRAGRFIVESAPSSPSMAPAICDLVPRTGRRFRWLLYSEKTSL